MTYSRTELREKIIQCQLTGMTARQAADRLGLSMGWLNERRVEFGLPCFEQPERSGGPKADSWTPDDEALLASCIEAGVTLPQAAQVLRRSRNAVIFKRWRLGLPRFRHGRPRGSATVWRGERLERLRQLHAQRLSYSDIARRLGTTRNAIAGAVRDYLKQPREARP